MLIIMIALPSSSGSSAIIDGDLADAPSLRGLDFIADMQYVQPSSNLLPLLNTVQLVLALDTNGSA